MNESTKNISHWTFLTNHAHVLLCIAKNPEFRLRDIADVVGITERAVHRIVTDLAEAGFIDTTRDGRCNVYVMHPEKRLRHPIEAHRQVADLIRLIEGGGDND
ncbi:MAG: MarR family transcriptional regulator [Deltaproteobacteria bacterium]|nr:MarR family transcriptional regulator [Deltaproteobacteria bacterium]MBN2672195.1 MarR family transcriptional regulator [Deltaproteobacteria bacterium]